MENLWDVTYKAVYNQTYECYSTVAPFLGVGLYMEYMR